MKSQRAPFRVPMGGVIVLAESERFTTCHLQTGRYFYPMDTQYVGNMGSSYGNQWIRLKKSTGKPRCSPKCSWLVVEPTPLKHTKVNGKDDIPYLKWKIKFMFETTNQLFFSHTESYQLSQKGTCPLVLGWNHMFGWLWISRKNNGVHLLNYSERFTDPRKTCWYRFTKWWITYMESTHHHPQAKAKFILSSVHGNPHLQLEHPHISWGFPIARFRFSDSQFRFR